MIALLLACGAPAPAPAPAPVPVPAPVAAPAADRWAEVVALAAPESCEPAPAGLAEALARDPRDPEEVRVQLGAWHAARPDASIRFDGPQPIAGASASLAWSKWILDGELPAWAHLLSSLDRCGPVEVARVVATHAERLCLQRGEAFARPAAAARWTPLRTLAAREAVRQVERAATAPAAQVEDLKRWLEGWVLDGDPATLPTADGAARPLAALTRGAMEADWLLLATKRASFEACATAR